MHKIVNFVKTFFSKFLTIFSNYNDEQANQIRVKRYGVKFGKECRFYSTNFSTEPFLIEFGDHVTVTEGVKFITHDGGVWVFRNEYPNIELFGRIKIGNNVFIGLNSIILLNTEIGDNCIVAAGSIVKGKYDSNSIIGGVPAKVIGNINDYYLKNLQQFTHIRNLSPDDKKSKILEKI
jgi:acetyltransferase-like isoleucine patch superfamily enzyme